MIINLLKWISIPTLLIASVFSRSAAGYEPLLEFVICFGVLIFVLRAVWLGQYFWAAGLLAIGIAFSPLVPADKLFLVLGIACIANVVSVYLGFQPRQVPVV